MVTFPYRDDQAGKSPSVRVSIYPDGVYAQHLDRIYLKPRVTHSRGKIKGFTAKSSTRLRLFCIQHECIGRTAYAHTWTTHASKTPEQWRQILDRMRHRCLRLEIPVIWRVQLQNPRNTPHLHCICFVANRSENDLLKLAWCESTGEGANRHALRSSVKFKEMTCPRWITYMSQRRGLHAEHQSGWQGKQWGVWLKKMLVERKPDVACIPIAKYHPFRRKVERLLVPKHAPKVRRRRLSRFRNWVRCLNNTDVRRLLTWAMETGPEADRTPFCQGQLPPKLSTPSEIRLSHSNFAFRPRSHYRLRPVSSRQRRKDDSGNITSRVWRTVPKHRP